MLVENYRMWAHDFYMTVIHNETATRKTLF